MLGVISIGGILPNDIELSIINFALFDFRFGIASFVVTVLVHNHCTIVDLHFTIAIAS
jgi:hypothetical protein